MPSTTATSAASSEPSHRFTSVVARTDPDWASAAGRSSAAMPGCWRTSASPYATTGSTSSCSRCFRPLAYSWLQAASPDNSENRLLVTLAAKLPGTLTYWLGRPSLSCRCSCTRPQTAPAERPRRSADLAAHRRCDLFLRPGRCSPPGFPRMRSLPTAARSALDRGRGGEQDEAVLADLDVCCLISRQRQCQRLFELRPERSQQSLAPELPPQRRP